MQGLGGIDFGLDSEVLGVLCGVMRDLDGLQSRGGVEWNANECVPLLAFLNEGLRALLVVDLWGGGVSVLKWKYGNATGDGVVFGECVDDGCGQQGNEDGQRNEGKAFVGGVLGACHGFIVLVLPEGLSVLG